MDIGASRISEPPHPTGLWLLTVKIWRQQVVSTTVLYIGLCSSYKTQVAHKPPLQNTGAIYHGRQCTRPSVSLKLKAPLSFRRKRRYTIHTQCCSWERNKSSIFNSPSLYFAFLFGCQVTTGQKTEGNTTKARWVSRIFFLFFFCVFVYNQNRLLCVPV